MGGSTNPEPTGFIRIPNQWSEIVVFTKKTGRLPRVKFKKGKVTLVYSSASVRFENKIECIINGKLSYTIIDGSDEWYLNRKMIGINFIDFVIYDKAGNKNTESIEIKMINQFFK